MVNLENYFMGLTLQSKLNRFKVSLTSCKLACRTPDATVHIASFLHVHLSHRSLQTRSDKRGHDK